MDQDEKLNAAESNNNNQQNVAVDFPPELKDEKGTNAKTIRCKVCDCKVLLPGVGVYTSEEFFLPFDKPMPGTSASSADSTSSTTPGQVLRDFWLVTNPYHFENIAFTKPADDKTKYITCADCERGVLGIVNLDQPNKIYVCHERVKYT